MGALTNTSQKSGGSQNNLSNSNRTFDSQNSQDMLSSLMNQYNKGGYADQTKNILSGLQGDNNIDNVISSNDYEANKLYGSRMAGLRAQGYRGGTAGNLFNQGQFTNDFTAQQEGNNANLRYQNNQQNYQNKMNLGQLYGQLNSQNSASGMSLLDMLAGNHSSGYGNSNSNTTSNPSLLSSIGQLAGIGALGAVAF